MLYKLHLILIIFIFLFFAPHVLAEEYFVDNFDQKNTELWNYIPNGGILNYSDGVLNIGSSVGRFPEVYSKKQLFGNENSKITFVFKYIPNTIGMSEYGPSGDGIGVGVTSSDGTYTFYQYAVWRDYAGGDHLIINDFGRNNSGICHNVIPFEDLQFRNNSVYIDNLKRDDWNVLTITYNHVDKSFVVNLNNKDYYHSEKNQCIPSLVTLGNPLSGANLWNTLSVDKIAFEKVGDNSKPKIIIIPGLGASWNEKAMVFNLPVANADWKMTPFVGNYDNLIKALEDNGLVKGKDFWVWNYDWRQPVEKSSDDLDSFINTNLGQNDKVVLIGHSLGGVISRIYAQKYGTNKISKIITLGSPHQGTLSAYEAWGGAKISDRVDVAGITLNVLVQLQKKRYESNLQTIRKMAPVLKDLLPTFDFIKNNDQVVP